jgi:hypothetical protein
MGDATQQQAGTSGRRLAIGIVVIGVLAAIAGLLFREFTPPSPPPTTQSSPSTLP